MFHMPSILFHRYTGVPRVDGTSKGATGALLKPRFKKPANLYFLFLMCLQMIPEAEGKKTWWVLGL